MNITLVMLILRTRSAQIAKASTGIISKQTRTSRNAPKSNESNASKGNGRDRTDIPNCAKNAERIRETVIGRMPYMSERTASVCIHFEYERTAIDIRMKDGVKRPIVQSNPPNMPPRWNPKNVAMLIPIGPGVTCAMAMKLPNSSSVIQWRPLTKSSMKNCVRLAPPLMHISPKYAKT